MSYGLNIFNAEGVIVASSEDRVLAVTEIFTLNWHDRQTAWRAHDFWDTTGRYGEPNVEVWRADGTFHYLYHFGYPSSFDLQPDMFVGVSCSYGGTVFGRDIHWKSGAMFRSDKSTITLAIARPIRATDNAGSTHGLVAYDADGNIAFHSDSKVLRVLKTIDGTDSIVNPSGYTPFFFMDGGEAFRSPPSGAGRREIAGVRINSATSYTRRILQVGGAAYDEDYPHARNPYKRGFIGLVDQTLFA